jgi:hypothetical protein
VVRGASSPGIPERAYRRSLRVAGEASATG